MFIGKILFGNSLAVQWLGLCAFTPEGPDSIPGQKLRVHKPCCMSKKKKIGTFLLTFFSKGQTKTSKVIHFHALNYISKVSLLKVIQELFFNNS